MYFLDKDSDTVFWGSGYGPMVWDPVTNDFSKDMSPELIEVVLNASSIKALSEDEAFALAREKASKAERERK